MNGDLLREATQALRDEAHESEAPAELSRARIMQSLHQRRRRRSARLALFVPLAAICIGSTAWAAATQRLPKLWQTVVELTTGASPAPAPVESKPKSVARRRAAPAPEPAPVVAPPSTAEPALEPPAPSELHATSEPAPGRAAERTVAPSAAPGSSQHEPTSAAPAARGRPDPTDALYRTAHELHFVTRDPARALAAWDAYLAQAPNGRFAVEARYNRALSLLRLGRTSEAERALEPFARGAYGSYRRAEAQALIGAVDAGTEP